MLGHAMFSIFPELQDVNVIRVLLAAFQTELHPNLLLLQYLKKSIMFKSRRNGSLVNLLSIHQIQFNWNYLD